MVGIKYLSPEHIHMMHKQAIKHFGGFDGYYNYTEGRIESILEQQYPKFGVDKYPTVFQKAAMLMYFFIKGHCFADGNKRVGIQSAIVFLEVNGYEDNLDNNEGYEKTMEIAALKISEEERDNYINDLADWLSQRFL